MGRTLQNTMVNLALENACDEATYQVGEAFKGGGVPCWPLGLTTPLPPLLSVGLGHGGAGGDRGGCRVG